MANKKTTLRVWQAARELKISSQEMMLLAGKHHWLCTITKEKFNKIKEEMTMEKMTKKMKEEKNEARGGKGMKARKEIKPDEMRRIFKEGGTFVITLEGVERFGVKGNTEYHLNGKKIINTFKCDEEDIEFFINMIEGECYEDWKVWEVINENKLAHFVHDLSCEEFDILHPKYVYVDEEGIVVSKKTNKRLNIKEVKIAVKWAKKRDEEGERKLNEFINEFETESKLFLIK